MPAPHRFARDTEAVLFDLDDTLVQTSYFNEAAIGAVVKVLEDRRVRLGLSEQDIRRMVHDARRDFGASYGRLFEELEKGLGISDDKILAELVVAYEKFEEASLRLYPGTLDLLKLLIRNRIKMGVITNGDAFRQWKKLLETGIADIFDVVIISDVVGVKKPDPRIFQMALDSLASDPVSSVFVGDRPDLDVRGAKQAGMATIRVIQGNASARRPSDDSEKADVELPSLEEVAGYLFGPAGL